MTLVLSAAAALAIAQQPLPPPAQEPPAQQTPQTPPEQATEPATTATREIAAEVVSTDATAKNIKVKVMIKKDAASQAELKEATIPVDEEAVADLGTVSTGDKVKLLCRMSGNKVIAVKDIMKAEAQPAEPPKPQEPPSQP